METHFIRSLGLGKIKVTGVDLLLAQGGGTALLHFLLDFCLAREGRHLTSSDTLLALLHETKSCRTRLCLWMGRV